MKTKYFKYYFTVFLTWSCTYTMITVYFNEALKIPASQVGAFMSIIPLVTLTFQPFWGSISDRLGDRKMVLKGLIVTTFSLALILPHLNLPVLSFGFYIVFMVFLSGQNPISDSLTIQFVNHDRSISYGGIRAWGSIGYAVGAFIVAKVSAMLGLKMIFYLAAVGYVLSFLALRPIETVGKSGGGGSYFKDLRLLLKEKQYVFILVYTFFLLGSFFAGEQFVFMYTRHAGVSLTQLGMITSLSVVVEIPFIFFSKKLIETYGEKKLIFGITVISALRLITLSYSSYFALFLFAGALRGIVVGIFVPLFVEMISIIAPKAVVASAISIYMAVSTGVASFLFTVLGSLIIENAGYGNLYRFYGLVTLSVLFLAFKLPKIESEIQ